MAGQDGNNGEKAGKIDNIKEYNNGSEEQIAEKTVLPN